MSNGPIDHYYHQLSWRKVKSLDAYAVWMRLTVRWQVEEILAKAGF